MIYRCDLEEGSCFFMTADFADPNAPWELRPIYTGNAAAPLPPHERTNVRSWRKETLAAGRLFAF
jgi:hypothetical protein